MNNLKTTAIDSLKFLAFCLAFTGIVIGGSFALVFACLASIVIIQNFGICLGLIAIGALIYGLIFFYLLFVKE